MRDLRLYYYQSGTLHKWSNSKNQYKFTDILDIHKFVDRLREKRRVPWQWVITEYFNNYDSKIIEII